MKAPAPEAAAEERQSLWLLAWPPAIWLVYFLSSYGAVSIFCSGSPEEKPGGISVQGLIFVLGICSLSGIGAIAWGGWTRYQLPGEVSSNGGDSSEDRHRFLGFAALRICGLSAVGTVYLMLGLAIGRVCQ